MSEEIKVTSHVHTTETPATQPARGAALQSIANLSARQLAHFHWREASEALSSMEHKVRDYDDERSEFHPHDEEEIDELSSKIVVHLGHVVAIATESAHRMREEIARQAAEKKGGAS